MDRSLLFLHLNNDIPFDRAEDDLSQFLGAQTNPGDNNPDREGRLPLSLGFSGSALEKFPGFGRKNSQISDLAAAIVSNLAKAVPENAFTSGNYRLGLSMLPPGFQFFHKFQHPPL
jgi:hypothetical protein